jgi:hypothetical protein
MMTELDGRYKGPEGGRGEKGCTVKQEMWLSRYNHKNNNHKILRKQK